MRTFENISNQVKAAGFTIPEDCFFNQMLTDLRAYEEPLLPKVMKWQKIFTENHQWLFDFCEEILNEDKIYALT
jgi:hypothetical protein